jgi:hypothetical protein
MWNLRYSSEIPAKISIDVIAVVWYGVRNFVPHCGILLDL